MNIRKMPLSSLQRPEQNVRMHTEKQLKEFERSVSMFGQLRPIVADEAGVILAGNGLFETLLRLDWEEADVLQVEGLTENQKKKLMLADNKIFGLGVDDLETFDAFLVDLKDDLDIPGFDEELLKSMVAQAGEVTEKLQEYGTLDEEEIEEIKAARERKDLYMTTGATDEGEDDEPEEADDAPGQEEPKEPVRQYVVCPHCGEKIWL
jgi:ParB-like chromosome segregation protein Spo0J